MAIATSTYVALALAAAAAGTSYYNAQNTAKKQDNSVALSIRNQSAKQQTADQKIAELVRKQSESTPQDEQKQQMDSYLATLQRGKQKDGLNSGAGGFSDAYRQDVAAADESLGAYGADRAGLLSRIDAPRLQRQNEGILFNDTTNELRGISRDAQQQAFLDNLKTNSIKENPWLGALSSGLSAFAGAYGGGADTGAWGAFTPTTNVAGQSAGYADWLSGLGKAYGG